jgi:carbonic anhydrase
MSNLDSMLERNKQFAAQQSAAGTLMPAIAPAIVKARATIIACADMRVDPAFVLGLEPGEAVVFRNIGGRVTPGLLEQMVLLAKVGQAAHEVPAGGGEFHIIVMHHTDCGMTHVAADTSSLAHYFQIPESDLKTKAVSDPRAAAAVDVATLRAIPALPAKWFLSGLVYNVATGLVEVVVPPAPIRAV